MARFIKYIGPAHVRQITAQEWRQVGITADTVVWGGFNGWSVDASNFTDDQIRKAIEPDSNFVIVGVDEGDEPQPVLNDRATPTSVAAGDFDLTNPEDLDRALNTTTEDGQVDDREDKTPSTTSGGK